MPFITSDRKTPESFWLPCFYWYANMETKYKRTRKLKIKRYKKNWAKVAELRKADLLQKNYPEQEWKNYLKSNNSGYYEIILQSNVLKKWYLKYDENITKRIWILTIIKRYMGCILSALLIWIGMRNCTCPRSRSNFHTRPQEITWALRQPHPGLRHRPAKLCDGNRTVEGERLSSNDLRQAAWA